jgi:hypothetical protein
VVGQPSLVLRLADLVGGRAEGARLRLLPRPSECEVAALSPPHRRHRLLDTPTHQPTPQRRSNRPASRSGSRRQRHARAPQAAPDAVSQPTHNGDRLADRDGGRRQARGGGDVRSQESGVPIDSSRPADAPLAPPPPGHAVATPHAPSPHLPIPHPTPSRPFPRPPSWSASRRLSCGWPTSSGAAPRARGCAFLPRPSECEVAAPPLCLCLRRIAAIARSTHPRTNPLRSDEATDQPPAPAAADRGTPARPRRPPTQSASRHTAAIGWLTATGAADRHAGREGVRDQARPRSRPGRRLPRKCAESSLHTSNFCSLERSSPLEEHRHFPRRYNHPTKERA